MNATRLRFAACLFVLVACAARQAYAQTAEGGEPPAGVTDESAGQDDEALKPTELGIRFTPRMASAMTKKFVEQMKPRYELDDKQAEEISDVMQRQFMKFARKNEALGRDMVELMMSTMIENDGRMPKEEGQQFAKMALEFIPRLREFFTEGSAEIGKKMSMKQRLRFTADVGVAAAGMIVFENRMKRWEEGKIGDFANPFFDPADTDATKADPEPINPNEHADHRQARKEVETFISWSIDPDSRWEGYIDKAARYYNFTESQKTSAQGILKDCRDRASAIKTKEWRAAVIENQILQRLTRRTADEFSGGPWNASLEREFKRMIRPVQDLDDEFKRRIDDLPDSSQRAIARESVRKLLSAKGVKELPN